ncbi:MAG: hypothetical protein VW701_19235, partial [Deltaproteobacteria bacterium]
YQELLSGREALNSIFSFKSEMCLEMCVDWKHLENNVQNILQQKIPTNGRNFIDQWSAFF